MPLGQTLTSPEVKGCQIYMNLYFIILWREKNNRSIIANWL